MGAVVRMARASFENSTVLPRAKEEFTAREIIARDRSSLTANERRHAAG